MTRVLHLMRSYGAHGGERQLAGLFRTGPKENFEERFALVYRDTECAALLQNIPELDVHWLWPFSVRPRSSAWAELAAMFLLLPIVQIQLMRLLRRTGCRICIAHGFQAALAAWPAAWLMRSVRFAYMHRGTKSLAGRNPVFRVVYRPFAVVAGVSRASSESLSGLVEPDRLHVVESGIDLQAIRSQARVCPRPGRAGVVIASVGRLMPGKGQVFLLRAFALFKRRCPEAELWLIGDGPDRKMLERESQRLEIADSVRFWGQRPDVPSFLASSAIFAYASESEGMSNAVLEAMASGVPSVVVDAPGVTECHLPNVTGFVVERAPEAMAAKLDELATDPIRSRRMGAAARDHVRAHFSLEANRQRYLALYRRLEGSG